MKTRRRGSFFLPFFLSWSVLGEIIREIFSLDGLVRSVVSLVLAGTAYYLASLVMQAEMSSSMRFITPDELENCQISATKH